MCCIGQNNLRVLVRELESKCTHGEMVMRFLNLQPKEKVTKQNETSRARDNCLIEDVQL